MRKNYILFSLLVFFSTPAFAQMNLDSLLNVLDKTIQEYAIYDKIKEDRLNSLKEKAGRLHPLSRECYNLNNDIYNEYKLYSSDSALYYLNKNLLLSQKIKNKEWEIETQLNISYMLSLMGLYLEAADILGEIDRREVPRNMLKNYYASNEHVCSEASSARPRYKPMYTRYASLAKVYRDSMLLELSPLSDKYMWIYEDSLKREGRYDQALKINQQRLSKTVFGTNQYATVSYQRFLIYSRKAEAEDHLDLLVLSAISDIRSSTKTQSSLMTLAQRLCKKGDLKHAYDYMNFSWMLSKKYNARMRLWVSIEPISMINGAYQDIINQKNKELNTYVVFITLLLLLLVVALVFIYRQMKSLAVAKQELLKMNEGLSFLNEELQQMNQNLRSTNIELNESNQIKEVYIARFFKLCSAYIDRLQAYKKQVNKKILKGQVADLQKMTDPGNDSFVIEIQELYTNFDSAFLNLFPNFVQEFNELLLPDEQIVLKQGELLNTELRIFALIRLGIKDSSQIAELLRYSVNTIYNYRARVKNKVRVVRDDFEELIARIR